MQTPSTVDVDFVNQVREATISLWQGATPLVLELVEATYQRFTYPFQRIGLVNSGFRIAAEEQNVDALRWIYSKPELDIERTVLPWLLDSASSLDVWRTWMRVHGESGRDVTQSAARDFFVTLATESVSSVFCHERYELLKDFPLRVHKDGN